MKRVNKKTLYIMLLAVICLLGIVIVPTYAKFASSFATGEDVVGLNLSFNIGISNLEEYEEVRVDANSYQVFNVEITNNSGSTAYYGIWYKMVNPAEINDSILIGRHADNEVGTSGSISNSGSTTATIIVKNNSNQNIKFNIGVASSTTSVDAIEYLGGKKLISGVLYEEDYSYNDTTSKYVSSSDSSIEFTTSSSNYDYTGSSQTFTANHDGVYKLEAWGASGGNMTGTGTDSSGNSRGSLTYTGGRGGYTSGIVHLDQNDDIYLYVGGEGKSNVSLTSNTSNADGGYNGGGSLTTPGQSAYGATGGGATDFRLVSGDWDDLISLESRIMVAAGGGGANFRNQGYGEGNGGYGGTITGGNGQEALTSGSYFRSDWADGYAIGMGGTQIEAGYIERHYLNGTVSNSLDYSVTSSEVTHNPRGGFGFAGIEQSGGGSGYYGGAGAGHGGAGGGSSYVSGYQGAVSAGNHQKFKMVYTSSSLTIYDGKGNSLATTTPTVQLQNIERTLNYIGKSNWAGDAYFHGQIFKFKITLANGTVVINYDFTQNTITDLSGNGYNGTLYGGASIKYDGSRYALYLDGVDDYLQVPTLPSSIDFAGGFTVEFEAIWYSLNSWSRIFDFGCGSARDNILVTTVDTTSQISFHIFNGSTSSVLGATSALQVNGINYGTDNSVCETGDSDITCSYHYSGKIFKEPTMIAGNASMPTHDGSSTMTGNSGNGYAKVTPIVPEVDTSSLVVAPGDNISLSDITCIDNGSGCKVVRTVPANADGLNKGIHNITVMVSDDYGTIYKYVKTFSVNVIRDINIVSIKIDGTSSDSLPTSGTYTMTSSCTKGSTLSWNTYNKNITYAAGAKVGDKCSLEFTTSTNYPKLSSMAVGSYVAYTGSGGTVGSTSVACKKNGSASSSTATDETEAPNSCSGQNAREDLDTSNYTYGYCYSTNYKYYTTGWRIAYIDTTDASNPRAILISAGSPECNSRTSSTGNVTYIQTANTKALKYCNSNYVDGNCTCTDSDADGLCDSPSTDAWAINDFDFYYMTKAISGYGKRLASSSSGAGSSLGDSGGALGTTLYCDSKYSYQECGYNNDLLDNGGYYWFADYYISSDTYGVYWNPFGRYVYSRTASTNAYGLRPVIRLSSSVFVTGGAGTMSDPYTIGN